MFAVVNVAQFLIIFDWFVYSGVVPAMMQELHLTFWEAGLPITVLMACMAVMQFVSGALSDRVSEPLLSMWGLGLAGIGCVLAATAHNLPVLILSRAFIGIGNALNFVPGLRMAGRLYEPPKSARAMGLLGGMANIGILASSVAAPLIERSFGWRGVHWAAALITTAALLLYPLVDASALRLRQPSATPGTSLLADFKRFGDWGNWVFGLCHTSSYGVLLGLSTWLPTVLKGPVEMPTNQVALLIVVFGAAGFASRLIALGDGPTGRLYTKVSFGLLALCIASSAFLIGPGHHIVMASLVILIGFLTNSPFSSIMGGAAAQDPAHAGAVLGVVNFVAIGAGMTLPVFFGWFKDVTGAFQVSLWFFAVVAAFGMALSWFLPSEHSSKPEVTHEPTADLT